MFDDTPAADVQESSDESSESVSLEQIETEAAIEAAPTNAAPPAPETEAATENAEEIAEPKTRFEKRVSQKEQKINDLTREEKEVERRIEGRKAELVALEATPVAEEAPQRDPKEVPLEEDFETTDEYLKELATWAAKTEIKAKDDAVEAAQDEARARKNHYELMNSWEDRVRVATETHPDFEEVVTIRPNNPAIEAEIMDSPYGAEMAYYYGTNREEAERVFAMPAYLAAREIHKLEHEFAAVAPLPAEASDREPTETKPAAPPKPARPPKPGRPLGASAPSVTKTFGNMTPAEYYKHREKARSSEEI